MELDPPISELPTQSSSVLADEESGTPKSVKKQKLDEPTGNELSSSSSLTPVADKSEWVVANLDTIPQVCIIGIHDYLPLQPDLLRTANLVCPSWAVVHPKSLIRRRALTILIGEGPTLYRYITHYYFNPPYELLNDDGTPMFTRPVTATEDDLKLLKFTELSLARAQAIFGAFPRVTSLAIVLGKADQLDGLLSLLQLYSDTLVNLQVYVTFSADFSPLTPQSEAGKSLMSSLTQLVHLRLHYLHIHGAKSFPTKTLPSVKMLTIVEFGIWFGNYDYHCLHSDLVNARLHILFPSLQIVEFSSLYSRCDTCYPNYGKLLPYKLLYKCVAHAMCPFRECANLRWVSVSCCQKWTREELLKI